MNTDHVSKLSDDDKFAPTAFSFRDRNAYAHANMRLRTRYDMEITIEEWSRLGEMFRRRQVNGVRRNHVGDQEGWVLLNGVAVCCYYSSTHGCVKTFFASPPPVPTVANAKATKVKPVAPVVIVQQVAVEDAPKPPKVKIPNPASVAGQAAKREAYEKHVAFVADGPYRKDLRWFKGIITSMVRSDWSRDEIWFMLSAVASMPENIHPSKNPDAAKAFIERNIADKKAYRATRGFLDGDGI